ncbi:MAG: cyanophycin synthetase [Balneolaceae bacterium]
MNILNIKVTSGPNYWSVRKHRLVVMQLDIEELETRPTHKINAFYSRLKNTFPGLYEHYCSEGVPGGFFERVKRGTWIGHVIEHIALELQIMAGYEVGFGRTRGTGTRGQYHIVFECINEESGSLTAKKAVAVAQDLVDGSVINVDTHVKEIREMSQKHMPGPSTSSLLQEAAKRDIPFIKLEDSVYQLGYGSLQKKIEATITSSTSNIAVETACDKEACRNLFKEMSVPIADGDVIRSADDLKNLTDKLGFPLVVKPVSGNQGRGITTNIKTYEKAVKAFRLAAKISEGVVVEQHISGNDYRLLTVDHKLVAAAKRIPAHIKGNGKLTIRELIDIVNEDPCRGEGHEKSLTEIKITASTKEILAEKEYTFNTVLPDGYILYLDHAANLSKGGTAEDVTDRVHHKVVTMAERISRIIGLDICGVDIMASTLEQPMDKTGAVVLEVNAAPGFRMHLSPTKGKHRNVAAPVLDMLFPSGNKSRIPIIAVTGTNGKTTTTRLISHILKRSGRRVGMTTTDGIYVNGELLLKGDCGGPKSAETVLKDPTVDTAVLECARGGILRSGLGFDKCDVAVVMNVTSDHLGLNGIHTLDQMARVKSVVPESVSPAGYAVLNADDKRVCAMQDNLNCNVVLFSMDGNNPRLNSHSDTGGICIVYEDRQIKIHDRNEIITVEKIDNIPLSFGGRAGFMIENILAATAATYIQNIDLADIRKSLNSFEPSAGQNPGRMNLFSFENYDVLVDYAHNAAGMSALKKFLQDSSYCCKTGIVSGIGDRRKEDNIEIGRLSAEIFDRIVIREDADLRGKAPGETTEMVKQGIEKSPYNPKVAAIPDVKQALFYAMENALPGTLITVCVENIDEAVNIMKEQQAGHANLKSPVLKMQFDSILRT